MGLTRAQRHNRMMDKVFDRAKSEGRGLVGNSHTDGAGVNSPAMKAAKHKALKKKLNVKHEPSMRFIKSTSHSNNPKDTKVSFDTHEKMMKGLSSSGYQAHRTLKDKQRGER